MNAAVIYICLVAAMSCICCIVYGFDKRQATNGGRRIPERTLHILATLGGWPGALLGQRLFRHKTQKPSFVVVFWITVVLHVVLVGTAAYVFLAAFKTDTADVSNSGMADAADQHKELSPWRCTGTVLVNVSASTT